MSAICIILNRLYFTYCWGGHGETLFVVVETFRFSYFFVRRYSSSSVLLSQDCNTQYIFPSLFLVHYSIQTLDDIYVQFNVYCIVYGIRTTYRYVYKYYVLCTYVIFHCRFIHQWQRKALEWTCTPRRCYAFDKQIKFPVIFPFRFKLCIFFPLYCPRMIQMNVNMKLNLKLNRMGKN